MLMLTPVATEVFVLVMGCIALLVVAWQRTEESLLVYRLSQLTLIGALIVNSLSFDGHTVLALHGAAINDPLAVVLRACILVISFIVFVYTRDYLLERKLLRGEYFVLALFAVLGMLVMSSAHNLLSMYMGLELLSLCLYAMVALHRDSQAATEAAMKYFVLGAIASGMLLYGMSMLYGVTGSLDLSVINAKVHYAGVSPLLLSFALVFIVVGVAFKLGAVPFHMWIPDVYEGAPTAVTLFVGSIPKLAGFALALRLLVDGLEGIAADWSQMLVILSILSIAVGNVIAIAQDNIKRMLAYSTIAHIGYMLLGILSATPDGYAASLFYTITYTLMSAGAFGMIILLGRYGFEADRLQDYAGLGQRAPWFALMMMIIMLSMAGVPPMLGFWGKWFVLAAVIDAGHLSLAVAAVVFSVIGAYYYLRIVKLMYFDTPAEAMVINKSGMLRLTLSLNALAVLVIGLLPGNLMALCLAAING